MAAVNGLEQFHCIVRLPELSGTEPLHSRQLGTVISVLNKRGVPL